MKFCIFGPGAIGGSIAARLAHAGYTTSVIVRGDALAAIRAQGLRYEGHGESFTVSIQASDDPASLGPQDVVIAAVKAQHLPEIAQSLKPLLHARTAVVYAVNGIPWWYFYRSGGAQEGRRIERLDPNGTLWDKIGVKRAIGCVVNFAGDVVAPNVRRRGSNNNGLSLGEPDGKDSERIRAIAAALQAAGYAVKTDVPVRCEVWSKLQRNVATSSITVLTSLSSGASAGDIELQTPYRKAMTEVADIARAYGFDIACDIDAHLAAQSLSRHRPAMLQDLDNGRSMEIDAQFTAPQELARAAGVATPTLDVLIGLALARARQAGLYAG